MRLSPRPAVSIALALSIACGTPAATPSADSALGASGAGVVAAAPTASGGTRAPVMPAPTTATPVSPAAVGGRPAVVAPSGQSGAGAGAVSGMLAGAGAGAGTGAGGASAGASSEKPVEVGHPQRFIASIHGSADKLVYVDIADPKQNWELDVPDGIQDFQLIGNNKLLVGYKFNFGYFEVDLATHRIDVMVRDFLTRQQAILTSVKRLPSGHTLIMAQGLNGGAKDLEVWEVDNDKMIYEKRSFKGCCGNLRVVRMTPDAHFLVGADNALVELDETGKQVASLDTGGSPTYMGLKTADGAYYATNGHGGQLLAFSPTGQRRVLGGRGAASAQKATIYQPGQFQILQNGHVVITNWTAENGGMGEQLVEYDPEGNMVWSWDDPAVRPQGMETLVVLDNLDPAVVNDDRDGVLEPQR